MILKAKHRRALLESSLIPLIWLIAMFALENGTNSEFLVSSVSFTNTLGACVLALRAYPGRWWRDFLLIFCHSLLMVAVIIFISVLFSVSTTTFLRYLGIIAVGSSVLSSGARLLVRFWHKWNLMRQRHFRWSLAHAHFMVVEGMILSMLLAILLVQIILFSTPPTKDSSLLDLVEYLFSIEPYINIAGGLTLIILLVVLPPSAFFAYGVSHRLVQRILALEQATALVEQGDYTVQVKVEGEDEIARLQARYNGMTAKLHQTIQKLQIEQATVAGLSKLQREMVANISHDLRTPLTTLQVYLDTLPTSAENSLIKEEIGHLRRLTDDLFDAAQQESLTLTLRLTPTQIKPLLEKIAEVTHATARAQRQIEIYTDVSPALPLLLIDPDRFSQVIRNLLQNALRWTLPGGMIQIAAAKMETEVRVDVQDTGIGIAADELSNIWRRSYRIDHSVEGSGLGLAQVKQLVEAMQGRVAVESVVNTGSCFSIYLPIFADE